MGRASFTRAFLTLFVFSIAVNAVLGIWALLSGDFGETQGRVLASSFLASAAMLSILVNVPGVRRRVLWPAPVVGAVTGAAGFALLIILVWTDGGDDWGRVVGSLMVVAAAATLAASLALIEVPTRLGRVHAVVDLLIAVLAITVFYAIWFEPDADWFGRLVGIESVLVAAMTLLIPVLSRFAPTPETGPVSPASGVGAAVRYCPACGARVPESPLGLHTRNHCDACGLTFAVEPLDGGFEPAESAPAGRGAAPG